MTDNDNASVLVLGIGNILRRDEGVGVRVIEALRDEDVPDDVELFDGGTFGAELIDVIADRAGVIVIDAIEHEGAPGSVFRFSGDDLAAHASASLSVHEIGLLDTLRMAKQLGCSPKEVLVLGVVPEDVGPGLELTPAVAKQVPKIVERVLEELKAYCGSSD